MTFKGAFWSKYRFTQICFHDTYCTDLKAVLQRRGLMSASGGYKHWDITSLHAPDAVLFTWVSSTMTYLSASLCIKFRWTFLGLWISTAPRTMRNLSWTCVIWGNSTSEDTHADLEVNELMLPHCSLSSHEPPSSMNIWNLAAQFCFACYWEWLPWQGSWTSTPHAVGHSLHLVQSLREPGFHKRNWVWKFFTLQ